MFKNRIWVGAICALLAFNQWVVGQRQLVSANFENSSNHPVFEESTFVKESGLSAIQQRAGRSDDLFEREIRPLLRKYCFECHEPGEMPKLEFLDAGSSHQVLKKREVFQKVYKAIEKRTMPPKDFDQPTEAERKKVTAWLKNHLAKGSVQQKPKVARKVTPDDQVGQYIVSIYQDRHGQMWFGTVAHGVARFDGKKLVYFRKKDGLAGDAVVGIVQDSKGHMWFGTHSGVTRFDGKSFQTFRQPQGIHGAGCNLFIDNRGKLWAGTNHGVFKFDGQRFVGFKLPVPKVDLVTAKWDAGKVWCLFQDSKGNMWFGRDGYGACKYDGKSFLHYTKKDGLCSNNVAQIAEDRKGRILFGCLSSEKPFPIQDGGVCRLEGKKIEKFPRIKGFSKNDCYTIHKDRDGDLWIGAIGVGVYKFDGLKFELFNTSDQPHLIRSFAVQSVLKDRNGGHWFGFSGGLFRLDGKSFKNVPKAGPWGKRATPSTRTKGRNENQNKAGLSVEERIIVPKNWWRETLTVPPGFASSMALRGKEYLRMPKSAYDPKSDWFCSYLFVIELSQTAKIDEKFLMNQMLVYYKGLASVLAKRKKLAIDPRTFSIRSTDWPEKSKGEEYRFEMNWNEPFDSGKKQRLQIRVKKVNHFRSKGTLFIAVSPQSSGSKVWKKMEAILNRFESVKGSSN